MTEEDKSSAEITTDEICQQENSVMTHLSLVEITHKQMTGVVFSYGMSTQLPRPQEKNNEYADVCVYLLIQKNIR